MPAKDKSKSAASAEGFTPERFERELQALATKAHHDGSWSRRAASQLLACAQAGLLVALVAVYSVASPLTLSPVYGSIPAAVWHSKLVMAACFAGWAGNVALRQTLPVPTMRLLPLAALYIPAVQCFMLGYSSLLGPRWGPVVTEAVTLGPLAVLSAAAVADRLEKTRVKLLPAFAADAAPGIGSWAWFKLVETFVARHVQANMGHAVVYTRLGLELVLGVLYALAAPSKLLVYAVPPLLHTLLLNSHVPSPAATSSLVSSMMSDGWLLLDRRESLTGYISVLQSLGDGFRVMRCDHSLLGGDWIDKRQAKLHEPIYGVFVMLEAVRLAETESPVPDNDARALVVGLGIGTTPSAFVTHGINTTAVEIDPVVHEYAAKYFDLKENNAPVLEDAVGYTAALAATAPETFDYIAHDVFTGGAEPVDLFTLEFMQGLATLLKPNGVVAINYAGNLAVAAPGIVYNTIKQVFPTCRVFREVPRDDAAFAEAGVDFANMVIFCTKTSRPLTFRTPRQTDHLGSAMRQEFLKLEHEIAETDLLSGDHADVLRSNDTSVLAAWHEQSAIGHWSVMRKVLPAWVWERW